MTESAERWFARFPDLASEPLFVIRGRFADGSWFAIRAWEGPRQAPNHTRLFCELRTKAGILFPLSDFYVGIPAHQTIDGRSARECAMSLFCIRPGDTDAEFFEHYTEGQVSFVEEYGEELSLLKLERYGEG